MAPQVPHWVITNPFKKKATSSLPPTTGRPRSASLDQLRIVDDADSSSFLDPHGPVPTRHNTTITKSSTLTKIQNKFHDISQISFGQSLPSMDPKEQKQLRALRRLSRSTPNLHASRIEALHNQQKAQAKVKAEAEAQDQAKVEAEAQIQAKEETDTQVQNQSPAPAHSQPKQVYQVEYMDPKNIELAAFYGVEVTRTGTIKDVHAKPDPRHEKPVNSAPDGKDEQDEKEIPRSDVDGAPRPFRDRSYATGETFLSMKDYESEYWRLLKDTNTGPKNWGIGEQKGTGLVPKSTALPGLPRNNKPVLKWRIEHQVGFETHKSQMTPDDYTVLAGKMGLLKKPQEALPVATREEHTASGESENHHYAMPSGSGLRHMMATIPSMSSLLHPLKKAEAHIPKASGHIHARKRSSSDAVIRPKTTQTMFNENVAPQMQKSSTTEGYNLGSDGKAMLPTTLYGKKVLPADGVKHENALQDTVSPVKEFNGIKKTSPVAIPVISPPGNNNKPQTALQSDTITGTIPIPSSSSAPTDPQPQPQYPQEDVIQPEAGQSFLSQTSLILLSALKRSLANDNRAVVGALTTVVADNHLRDLIAIIDTTHTNSLPTKLQEIDGITKTMKQVHESCERLEPALQKEFTKVEAHGGNVGTVTQAIYKETNSPESSSGSGSGEYSPQLIMESGVKAKSKGKGKQHISIVVDDTDEDRTNLNSTTKELAVPVPKIELSFRNNNGSNETIAKKSNSSGSESGNGFLSLPVTMEDLKGKGKRRGVVQDKTLMSNSKQTLVVPDTEPETKSSIKNSNNDIPKQLGQLVPGNDNSDRAHTEEAFKKSLKKSCLK